MPENDYVKYKGPLTPTRCSRCGHDGSEDKDVGFGIIRQCEECRFMWDPKVQAMRRDCEPER